MNYLDLTIEREIISNEIKQIKNLLEHYKKYNFPTKDWEQVLNEKIEYEKTLY